MNMRPENRCAGSGRPYPTLGLPYERGLCPCCHRPGIRIRTDGTFYEHSSRGPTFNDLLTRGLRRRRREQAALREILASTPVQLWFCPVEEHRHGYPEPPRETVRWIDGVAHCMEPDCGRTSAGLVTTN